MSVFLTLHSPIQTFLHEGEFLWVSISVLVSLSSFYSKLLNDRLIEVVEKHRLLGEAQNGFRQGRCGADNVFVLNTILWRAKALGDSVHLGFVDVSKAYDSVNREVLWKKLEEIRL